MIPYKKMSILENIIGLIYLFIIGTCTLINFPQFFFSLFFIKRESKRVLKSQKTIPKDLKISVIVPFYNEGSSVIKTLESVIAQNVLPSEIILVDDGSDKIHSTDLLDTFSFRGITTFQKNNLIQSCYKTIIKGVNVTLVQAFHQGKAKALDLGLSLCKGKLVVCIDGDTVIAPGGISALCQPFLNHSGTVATFGSLGILSDDIGKTLVPINVWPRTLLGACQLCDMWNSLMVKLLFNRFDTHYCIIGACACFKASTLKQLGGFGGRTLTEDRDICLDIYQRSLAKDSRCIQFVPSALALTKVPDTWRDLISQQYRWFGGWIQTLIKYRALLFNPSRKFLSILLILLALECMIAPFVLIVWLFLVPIIFLFYPLLIPTFLIITLSYWLMRFILVGGGCIFLFNRYGNSFFTSPKALKLVLYYSFIYPIFLLVTKGLAVIGYSLSLFKQLKW